MTSTAKRKTDEKYIMAPDTDSYEEMIIYGDNYSHSVLMAIFRWTWVSQYQNVSILDFTGPKDGGGGGDNWSYKREDIISGTERRNAL